MKHKNEGIFFFFFLNGLINPDYSLITSLKKKETGKREIQCYIMVLILIPPYECYVTALVEDEVKEERQRERERKDFTMIHIVLKNDTTLWPKKK